MNTTTWTQWKESILEVIRSQCGELLSDVGQDDIDWEAWKPLYEQGYTAYAAVSTAFSVHLVDSRSQAYAI